MINIDNRLIDLKTANRVNEKELWLLVHVVKRINVKNMCWPSNDLLLADTGWHIEKLQSVKKSLVKKGLLEIFRRGDKTNVYQITTEFLGIFVNFKGEPMEYAPNPFSIDGKSDTYKGAGKTNRKAGGKTNNKVLSNEVLVFTESKDSVPQKENCINTTSEQSEEIQAVKPETKTEELTEKKGAADFPEYKRFIEIWMESYKVVGLRMPRDGAKVKSLIKLTRDHLSQRGVIPTEKNVVEFWDIFVKNLNKTWGHGKDLATIDSKYTSLIFEIENGKAFTRTTTRPTDRFSDFAQ